MNKIPSKRLQRIRASMAARGLDAVLVTCPENRLYLSGFRAEDPGIGESVGALLLLRGRKILLTDGRYEIEAHEDAPDWEVVIYRKGLVAALETLLKAAGVKKIAYEPAYLTCDRHQALVKAMPGLEITSLGGSLEAMRAVKEAEEIRGIRRAIKAAEAALDEVWRGVKAGMTERDVAWRLLEGLWRHADGPSFPPIVASGPNGALPHAVPTDRKIAEGEPVIIDMGAKLDGYCSDMTRTLFIGPPKPHFAEIYRTVREAQKAAMDALRPSLTGRQADRTARQVIDKAGYGLRFVHALGHGVGLAVHEAPTLSRRNAKALKPGMVVTVEPGIYLPGEGGVRLEDMALITKDGAENLSRDAWFYEI